MRWSLRCVRAPPAGNAQRDRWEQAVVGSKLRQRAVLYSAADSVFFSKKINTYITSINIIAIVAIPLATIFINLYNKLKASNAFPHIHRWRNVTKCGPSLQHHRNHHCDHYQLLLSTFMSPRSFASRSVPSYSTIPETCFIPSFLHLVRPRLDFE